MRVISYHGIHLSDFTMHVWNEVRDTRFELYRVHCSVSEYLRQNLNAGDAQAGYGYLLNGGSHVLSSDGEH